jgi:hypothetical protein
MKKFCGTCYWWIQSSPAGELSDGAKIGTCHAYPPDNHGERPFPITSSTDLCTEHKDDEK